MLGGGGGGGGYNHHSGGRGNGKRIESETVNNTMVDVKKVNWVT